MIFLRALLGGGGSIGVGPIHAGGPGPVYLCGLIPLFIGVAMIVYVLCNGAAHRVGGCCLNPKSRLAHRMLV